MIEQMTELKQRLVIGRKRDGRCCYDPQAKRELIEACFLPGVSVAKLALAHGINANLLRTWMTKHQRQSLPGVSVRSSAATPSPFIPVVPVSAHRSPIPSPVRIPTQTGQPFRRNLDTDSEANWTLIPTESGQPKVIT